MPVAFVSLSFRNGEVYLRSERISLLSSDDWPRSGLVRKNGGNWEGHEIVKLSNHNISASMHCLVLLKFGRLVDYGAANIK